MFHCEKYFLQIINESVIKINIDSSSRTPSYPSVCIQKILDERGWYVQELAWDVRWIVKVLVIVSSVSDRTRNPRIKINSHSAYIDCTLTLTPKFVPPPTTLPAREGSGGKRIYIYIYITPSFFDIEPPHVNTEIRRYRPLENQIVVSAFNAIS